MKRFLNCMFRAASHLSALAILPVLTYHLWSNLRFLSWARRHASTPLASTPRVSVLVPARNESATIRACIESLLHQEYAAAEIIVLDDHSTDGTPEQLDALAVHHPRVKVIHATADPPAGSNGKSHACQRLAEHASGDWLLFTDADTLHTPRSLAQGITQAVALDVDFLSVFPYQRTESWSERLVVSFIIDFLPLIGLNLRAIWLGEAKSILANGQYLLIRTSAYQAVGGHRAIAGAVTDDLALAKLLKRHGRKISLVNGTDMLSCRMYRNASEVWNGFLKNILLGLETSSLQKRPSWWALPFAWGYASLFLTPYYHLLSGKSRKIALIEIVWLAALRGVAGLHLKRPWDEILTTPLGALSVTTIGLGALYRRWRGQKIMWKGRSYWG